MTRLSEIRERHDAAIRRANDTHVVDSRDDDIGWLLKELDSALKDANRWRAYVEIEERYWLLRKMP